MNETPKPMMVQQDPLPADLKIITNNENGRYTLFGSRKESRLFVVFRVDSTPAESFDGIKIMELELPYN